MRAYTVLILGLAACGPEPVDPGVADVFSLGDSLLDFNVPDSDIALVAADDLGLTLARGAVGGSTMLGDETIGSSYVDGEYTLLIASGGGNDFAECGCDGNCGEVIEELISEDGTSGAIPDLAAQAVADGAYVAWVGYLRPMEDAEEFANCGAELDELTVRLEAMEEAWDEVLFVDGTQIGTGVEGEYYAEDGYHPSPVGSTTLGLEVSARAREVFGL